MAGTIKLLYFLGVTAREGPNVLRLESQFGGSAFEADENAEASDARLGIFGQRIAGRVFGHVLRQELDESIIKPCANVDMIDRFPMRRIIASCK